MDPQAEFTSNDIFPRILLEAMTSKGWTQSQLGAACGISQGTISNYLRGKREPTGNQLRRMAMALGVTMDWLLTGEEPKYPNFIIWKDGFILAHWGGTDAGRAEERMNPGKFTRFRFLPEDDPNSIPREEQIRFHQRYVAADEAEKREMLSLGPGTERLFSARLLNALESIMKQQLEESK
jgi:transcriptional regulator with XRE-family HTH domain